MTALARYLLRSGETQVDFARRVGLNQATISKLCRGALVPSLEVAVKIQRETAGAVSVEAWIEGAA